MTPQQFWEEDPDLFWSYWYAYEKRRKNDIKDNNINSYNLSQYIYLAIRECLQFSKNPKKIFPRKPFELNFGDKPKMTNKDYQEIRKIQMIRLEKMFNSQNK